MSQLTQFLDGAAHRPYRELVKYHLQKQSTVQLQVASVGEAAMLPERLQPLVMDYIDATSARFGYDADFWRTATCQEAFERIIALAIQTLPLQGILDSVHDAMRPENHHLAFQLFQIPTLSFAYSASTQRAQRKFMGIRKGLFG